MRLGLFLNFEHRDEETSRAAFARQIDLALLAEDLGYDELWVSEHHFTSFTQSGSIMPLMAYLAGRTNRIRIGAAAILLPLHDPVRVAEDLATIDTISDGRLDVGLARGGPFPSQYAHFHVAAETAREQAAEATEFLLRLLTERDVTFRGRWYESEGLTVHPRLVQEKLPVWIASATRETVVGAATAGFGLMAGHAWSLGTIDELCKAYHGAGQGRAPDIVVLRTAFVADTDTEAIGAAMPAMELFATRMRAHMNRVGAAAPVALDKALAAAIVGSPETCRRRIDDLQKVVSSGSAVLKVACHDFSRAAEILRRFRREVLPGPSESSVPAGPEPQPTWNSAFAFAPAGRRV